MEFEVIQGDIATRSADVWLGVHDDGEFATMRRVATEGRA